MSSPSSHFAVEMETPLGLTCAVASEFTFTDVAAADVADFDHRLTVLMCTPTFRSPVADPAAVDSECRLSPPSSAPALESAVAAAEARP